MYDTRNPLSASTRAPADELTAADFLRALWPNPEDLPASARLNIHALPGRRSAWFAPTDVAGAAEKAAELAETANAYTGCSLIDLPARVAAAAADRSTTAENLDQATIRGTHETALAIPGTWLDVDVGSDGKAHKRTDLPPDVPTFLEFLKDAFPLRQTITIDSGHGVQLWWLHNESWVFEKPGEREDAADLVLKFQYTIREKAKARGWHLDSTHSLAQVLRLPGTRNRKPGLPVVPVQVLDYEPSRRYSVDDLEQYLLDEGWQKGRIKAEAVDLPEQLPTVDVDQVRMPPWIRDLIRQGPDADPEHYSQRYIVIWRIIQELIECGHDDVTVAAILLDPKHRISEKAREQGRSARKWITPQIGKARAIHNKTPRIVITEPVSARANGHAANGTDKYADDPGEPDQPVPPAADPPTDSHRYGLTELGNAEVFVAQHGPDVRYVSRWKSWLEYDDCRWQTDDSGGMPDRMKRTGRSRYAEAAEAPTKARADAVAAWAKRSEEAKTVRNALWLAQSDPSVAVRTNAFDTDVWLFNAKNGTIDLRDGRLRPHDRSDLITKLAPVDYAADAACPVFLAFLERIMGGNSATIRFLQRAIGYSLTGLTTEQVLFLLYGLGANGKSTLLEIIRALLGDYSQQADFSTFLVSKHDRIRNDLARLRGARFVSAVETDSERRLSEAVVKQMTGGDTITARFLFSESFEYVPSFKLWLAANHRPEIRGTDHAMWRRIRLIPFSVTIPDSEQDKALPDKLRAELPGILAWAVRGCLDWQRDGLGLPEEVKEATAAYRAEMDVLGDFLEDRCALEPGVHVLAEDLYGAYKAWCDKSGAEQLSQRTLGLRLSERGFTSLRMGKKRARGWGGIRLAEQGTFEDE